MHVRKIMQEARDDNTMIEMQQHVAEVTDDGPDHAARSLHASP